MEQGIVINAVRQLNLRKGDFQTVLSAIPVILSAPLVYYSPTLLKGLYSMVGGATLRHIVNL